MEIWRQIWEAPEYSVSNEGRVRHDKTGRILNGGTSQYARVTLKVGRFEARRSIHELVLEAFVCHRPDGKIGNHKDLNKRNNHLFNLEWVTPSENIQHAWDNGAFTGVRSRDPEERKKRLMERIERNTKEDFDEFSCRKDADGNVVMTYRMKPEAEARLRQRRNSRI